PPSPLGEDWFRSDASVWVVRLPDVVPGATAAAATITRGPSTSPQPTLLSPPGGDVQGDLRPHPRNPCQVCRSNQGLESRPTHRGSSRTNRRTIGRDVSATSNRLPLHPFGLGRDVRQSGPDDPASPGTGTEGHLLGGRTDRSRVDLPGGMPDRVPGTR